MEIDHLLSDEFVNFSQQIAKLQHQRKAKKQELKAAYENAQEEFRQIDEVAAQLAQDFEDWKNGQVSAQSVPAEKDKE